MPSATDHLAVGPDRAARVRVAVALLAKEWREQRWRFLLGTVVLTGMLAGMLRAQVIPPSEAALLIYWPVGILMVIFLAMGPVASERADRTWEFLVAQPASRADVLTAKWAVGLLQLVGMMVIATAAGGLAMWSRAYHGPVTALVVADEAVPKAQEMLAAAGSHPVRWLCGVATFATIALASWYTPLFMVLARARNEFTAALGGILLTLALHIWLAQFVAAFQYGFPIVPAMLNPIAPLAVLLHPKYIHWRVWICLTHLVIWIVLPVLAMRRIARRAATA